MPTKHIYRNGRAGEYYEANKIKMKEGFLVAQRSAGSHSPVDIWCIDPVTHRIKLVQKKTGKTAKKERVKAKQDISSWAGTYEVTVEIR